MLFISGHIGEDDDCLIFYVQVSRYDDDYLRGCFMIMSRHARTGTTRLAATAAEAPRDGHDYCIISRDISEIVDITFRAYCRGTRRYRPKMS